MENTQLSLSGPAADAPSDGMGICLSFSPPLCCRDADRFIFQRRLNQKLCFADLICRAERIFVPQSRSKWRNKSERDGQGEREKGRIRERKT